MWRNWNLNLPINPAPSSDEDDHYESPVDKDDPNNLVSPRRPHQSASASPRALLHPDPPPVEEVLASVKQQLRNNPSTSRQGRADHRNAFREAQEAAEAAAAAAANIVRDDVVDFETENGNNGAKASELGRQIKVEFSPADIRFWFAELDVNGHH